MTANAGVIGLSFTGLTAGAALAILNAAQSVGAVAEVRGTGKEAAPAAGAVAAAPAPSTAPTPSAPTPTPAPATGGVTLADVQGKIQNFVKLPGKGGAGKAKEILGQYGVAAAKDLKPEHFAAVAAALDAAAA
jgi:hypothetical protein